MLSILFLLPVLSSAATLQVPSAYPTIQDAINGAKEYDEIWVAPGTYIENIDYLGKEIRIISTSGPNVTIIDGNRTGSVVTFSDATSPTSAPMLQGFSIQNGSGQLFSGLIMGGGVLCLNASAQILDNKITGNTAELGAGITVYSNVAAPRVSGNHISYNYTSGTASQRGGGIYWLGHLDITHNIFLQNFAGSGGGLYGVGDGVISDNKFLNNSVANMGGGIVIHDSSKPEVKNNFFKENTSAYGGAICCRMAASPILNQNIMNKNLATMKGGGVYCAAHSKVQIRQSQFIENTAGLLGGGVSGTLSSSIDVSNSLFFKNTADKGGAMDSDLGDYKLWGCSLANNWVTTSAGAINLKNAQATVVNSILWENGPSAIQGSAKISFSNVQYGFPGTGNINTNPLFRDLDNGDLHLTYPSPCRDTGSNNSAYGSFDFENDARIAGGKTDMGADEYAFHLYYAGDPKPNAPVSLRLTGKPSDLFIVYLSLGVYEQPIPTTFGDWFLELPAIPILSGSLSSQGFYEIIGNIPGSTPLPLDLYLQALSPTILTPICVISIM